MSAESSGDSSGLISAPRMERTTGTSSRTSPVAVYSCRTAAAHVHHPPRSLRPSDVTDAKAYQRTLLMAERGVPD